MNPPLETEKEIATDKSNQQDKQSGTYFPMGILSVSQEEFDQLELTVKKGMTEEEIELPSELQGHLFLVGPAGTVSSTPLDKTSVVLPSLDGWTSLFNGDGMIYRFDFKGGKVHLKNRIVKTPCYYADEATHKDEKYKNLKFKNFGYGRLSVGKKGVKLGTRNQLNTAILPFKFPNDERERLLITWDTGRPYEIDPNTLKLIAPVGLNKEWSPVINLSKILPVFFQVMTSGHPCFDPRKKDGIFTVNVGKSLSTILWLERSIVPKLEKLLQILKKTKKKSTFEQLIKWLRLFFKVFVFLEKFFQLFSKKDFVYLMRWNGQHTNGKDSNELKSWKVVNKFCRPIKIEQTLHQMGITEDYIVLVDTSFKLNIQQALPYVYSEILSHLQLIFIDLLDYPALPHTNLYIIRRADLNSNKKEVKASHVKIPYAMAHYHVDYQNPDGKITLHAGHLCATDPSETIRNSDRSVWNVPEMIVDYKTEDSIKENRELTSKLQDLAGSFAGPLDLGILGCHVIDAKSCKVKVESKYTSDINYTWTTSFCDFRHDLPQTKDIYWNNWGCWTNTLSRHIYNLYKDYEQREISLEEVLKITRKGIPSSLCRLHIQRSSAAKISAIQLEDHYLFPKNYLGTSMQFVPKAGTSGSTDGYIICVVITSDNWHSENPLKPVSPTQKNWSANSEIWIFDAKNLAQGPCYRLSHAKLNLGFTLHTAWLPPQFYQASSVSTSSYNIREDYDWLINQQPEHIKEQIRELFKQYIYPNYEDMNINT